VGYWVDGELVLDVHHDGECDDSQMEDDEYDSNREDCDANDYPDEGDSDVCCNSAIDRGTGMTPPRCMNGHTKSTVSDSDDESDYNIDAIDFRNRTIDLDSVHIGGTLHRFGGCNMQDDEDFDSDDGEYRGFMCRTTKGFIVRQRHMIQIWMENILNSLETDNSNLLIITSLNVTASSSLETLFCIDENGSFECHESWYRWTFCESGRSAASPTRN
jgi:hypothetical protein